MKKPFILAVIAFFALLLNMCWADEKATKPEIIDKDKLSHNANGQVYIHKQSTVIYEGGEISDSGGENFTEIDEGCVCLPGAEKDEPGSTSSGVVNPGTQKTSYSINLTEDDFEEGRDYKIDAGSGISDELNIDLGDQGADIERAELLDDIDGIDISDDILEMSEDRDTGTAERQGGTSAGPGSSAGP